MLYFTTRRAAGGTISAGDENRRPQGPRRLGPSSLELPGPRVESAGPLRVLLVERQGAEHPALREDSIAATRCRILRDRLRAASEIYPQLEWRARFQITRVFEVELNEQGNRTERYLATRIRQFHERPQAAIVTEWVEETHNFSWSAEVEHVLASGGNIDFVREYRGPAGSEPEE